jgi:MoaA/NifB/PqqE/SkfB family radical SAM enzyme
MDVKKMDKVCSYPFTFIEIRQDGNVWPCCPGWATIPLGNIFKLSFDDIWNGKQAQEFRRSVLDGSYEYCDFTRCKVHLDGKDHNLNMDVMSDKIQAKELGYVERMAKYPEILNLGQDNSCNVRCIMCRDHQIHTSSEETAKLNNMVENVFLPMCKDAKHIICSPSGELFASRHSRFLIKAIAESCSDAKFIVRTNGLLCDKKNCDALGITNKMENVVISLHAVTKSMYDKIVKDSDFDRIMKNIEWLAQMKKQNKIRFFRLVMVVSRINYRQMKDFAELAFKYGADITYTEFFPYDTEMGCQYNKMAINKEFNPCYNRFVKIVDTLLEDPRIKEEYFAVGFRNLKPIGLKKWIKYRVMGLFNRELAYAD